MGIVLSAGAAGEKKMGRLCSVELQFRCSFDGSFSDNYAAQLADGRLSYGASSVCL